MLQRGSEKEARDGWAPLLLVSSHPCEAFGFASLPESNVLTSCWAEYLRLALEAGHWDSCSWKDRIAPWCPCCLRSYQGLLSHPASPCPALPCPARPCPARPCPALPGPSRLSRGVPLHSSPNWNWLTKHRSHHDCLAIRLLMFYFVESNRVDLWNNPCPSKVWMSKRKHTRAAHADDKHDTVWAEIG